jgi:hypothetical protein
MMKQLLRVALCGVILNGAAPAGLYFNHAYAQTAGNQAYNIEQLDALLAPAALYPDALLAQVLMASTFPLNVVSAGRWLEDPANKSLSGDALVKALGRQTWDPSVKSLVPFPSVLALLNSNLDWTQQLGYAFADQQAAVMDSVQRLRAQAQTAGNLKTTEQQIVRVEKQVIIIEPARPTVVYVPSYNPVVVYGAWPYFDRVELLGTFFAPLVQSRRRLPPLSAEAGGDGAASAFVALVDPGNQRVLALRLARQCFLQNLNDVARRQQRQARLMSYTLFGNEQHRQHHHRDVVVPRSPAECLIVRQSTLALGIFKGALDPVTVSLHLPQTQHRRIRRSIGQVYLIVFSDLTSRRTIRCQHRGVSSSPSHSQTRRCARSTRNTPRVPSRRSQRIQSLALNRLTKLSTVTDATDAWRFCAGRPRPGWAGGTTSSGGSVQTRWVR